MPVSALDTDFAYWLSGLIDGEGHFGIRGINKSRSAPGCRFNLVMRADDTSMLRKVVVLTGIGRIDPRKAHGASMPGIVWCVESKSGCFQLVALLDACPLRTRKALDYAIWREAVLHWQTVKHVAWHGKDQDHSVLLHLRTRLIAIRKFGDAA